MFRIWLEQVKLRLFDAIFISTQSLSFCISEIESCKARMRTIRKLGLSTMNETDVALYALLQAKTVYHFTSVPIRDSFSFRFLN